jgi:RNA polymerase sigma factor (sigma-70 family)
MDSNSSQALQLLATHSGWLRRLAYGLVADHDDAADVVQETMLSVWRHPPRLDRDIRPWGAEVLRNRAHDDVRRRHRRDNREAVALELNATPVETPEQLLQRFQLHRMVTEAALALDEPFRQTL